MKNTLRFYIKMLSVLCLSMLILLNFPIFERAGTATVMAKSFEELRKEKTETAKKKKKKGDDDDDDDDDDSSKPTGKLNKNQKEARKKYAGSQKKLKQGKLKDAITMLKAAIKKDKQPTRQYYPYLQLGLVYLKSGNSTAAQRLCTKSKKIGAAPSKIINQCLAFIAQMAKNEPTPQPEPTAIPKPAPTPTPEPVVIPTAPPEPVIPAPPSDDPPAIAITSEVPERTENATLTIIGVATDDHGIADVTVQVRKPDTKTLVARPRTQINAEQFEATLPLEIGKNEIVIEAIDTSGQVGKRTFLVIRNHPPQQEPVGSKAAPPLTEPLADAEQKRGNVYAVIIGVGNFQDAQIPPLRFTVNDAQKFHDVLTDPNYGGVPKEHVQLFLNEEATDRNIKTAIGQWLSSNAREEDTVIIYYSGHGAPEGEEKYWVTYNADINNLYATALSNNDIYDMLNRVESKRMITFLDSCYSAATVNRKNQTRDIQVEIPWENFEGEGRVTISASNGKQLSLEMDSYQHGIFTYYLLTGMKGKADGTAGKERDGVVEVEELWNYVKDKVSETAKKEGNRQTPVLQGSLTSGIPLTYNLAYLKELERKRLQEKEEKQATLQALFEQEKIIAEHFDCASKMIEAGQNNRYLNEFLKGGISAETFSKYFKCDTQQ